MAICLTTEYLHSLMNDLMYIRSLTITDIKWLWAMENDIMYEESYLNQKNLPEHPNDPLYVKMIRKFRDLGKQQEKFYCWLDAYNQDRIRLLCFANANSHDSLVFMNWLSRTRPSPLHQVWLPHDGRLETIKKSKIDPIDTFFSLEKSAQDNLVGAYNQWIGVGSH